MIGRAAQLVAVHRDLHGTADLQANETGMPLHQAGPLPEALGKLLFVPLGDGDAIRNDEHGRSPFGGAALRPRPVPYHAARDGRTIVSCSARAPAHSHVAVWAQEDVRVTPCALAGTRWLQVLAPGPTVVAGEEQGSAGHGDSERTAGA